MRKGGDKHPKVQKEKKLINGLQERNRGFYERNGFLTDKYLDSKIKVEILSDYFVSQRTLGGVDKPFVKLTIHMVAYIEN